MRALAWLAGLALLAASPPCRPDRAAIPGRSVLAQAAAQQLAARPGREHRGRFARPRLGAAAPALADRRREGRHAQAAAQQVLRARARRSWSSMPTATAPGAGAVPDARLRLGRPTSTASSSTARAPSGWPATPTTTARSQVHPRRQVPAAHRQVAARAAAATTPRQLGRPADLEVDEAANELYVADGYGNRRVIVFDAETGAYKRHWGAYGKQAERRQAAGLRSRRAGRTAVRQPGALRDGLARTASSTSATAPTTASRCSRRTAPSSPNGSTTSRHSAPARSGASTSGPTPTRATC